MKQNSIRGGGFRSAASVARAPRPARYYSKLTRSAFSLVLLLASWARRRFSIGGVRGLVTVIREAAFAAASDLFHLFASSTRKHTSRGVRGLPEAQDGMFSVAIAKETNRSRDRHTARDQHPTLGLCMNFSARHNVRRVHCFCTPLSGRICLGDRECTDPLPALHSLKYEDCHVRWETLDTLRVRARENHDIPPGRS